MKFFSKIYRFHFTISQVHFSIIFSSALSALGGYNSIAKGHQTLIREKVQTALDIKFKLL